jgi:TatD DNase family protein
MEVGCQVKFLWDFLGYGNGSFCDILSLAMRVFDAHTHIAAQQAEELAALLEGGDFAAAISVSTPEEAELALRLRERFPQVYVSVGVHPWHAGRVDVDELLPYIYIADAVGEIGLDSVWSDTDLDTQFQVFFEQLAIAQGLDMPVVLHTKGCEEEIAQIIDGLDGVYLVHWYSAQTLPAGFLNADCFFTVAPDPGDLAQMEIVNKIPLTRLMTESDGAGSLDWIRLGKPALLPEGELKAKLADVPAALERTVHLIAEAKGVSAEEAAEALYENARMFYSTSR